MAVIHLRFIQPEQGRRVWALLAGAPTPVASPAPTASWAPTPSLSPTEQLDEAKRLLALTPPRLQEALSMLEAAGSRGEPAAWVWLGQLYAEGKNGVPRDLTQAVRYFRRGAKGDNPTAMLWLGVLNRDGRGLPADPRQARVWFERAIEVAGPEHRQVREQAEKFLDKLREQEKEETPDPSEPPPDPPEAPAASASPARDGAN